MPFWELTVPASAEASEGLANFLWEQGALGVVEEEAPGASPRLRAFFAEAASSATLCRAVGDYLASLRTLGLAVDGADPQVAPVLDEPWGEAWRAAFTPRPVGRRLLIVPPWESALREPGRTTIVIEPGRAFGTGSHGSTRGCLLLLEGLVERAAIGRALDVGTGTGILAIAAAALGGCRVTALDADPDAVSATRTNAGLNGAAGQVQCVLGDLSSAEGTFPLILANLLAASHIAHAPRYRELLSPGGRLIVGGILSDEADAVGAALGGHGLALAGSVDVEGWASLLLLG